MESRRLFGIGSIASLATIISFLLDTLTTDENIKYISGIIIAVGLFILIVTSIIGLLSSDELTKSKLIKKGKAVINNTKNKIIMYGGDISWADDYATDLDKLIKNSRTVEIIYPKNKHNANNIKTLESINAKIYSIPEDIGLRFIISDPNNPRECVIFLATKIKRSGKVKYQAKLFTFKDDIIFDTFINMNNLISQTRQLLTQSGVSNEC